MTAFWQCEACGKTEKGRLAPEICEGCGNQYTYTQKGAAAPPARLPRVVLASDVADAVEIRKFATGDSELDECLRGGLAAPSFVGLWGEAGSGKSRCALRWLTNIGRVLWCSLEMPEALVVATARSCGARLDRLLIAADDIRPSQIAELATRAHCEHFAFDSISELDAEHWNELIDVARKWRRGIALVICHANAEGKPKGPTQIRHVPDYVLRASPEDDAALVTIQKSRHSPKGAARCALVK